MAKAPDRPRWYFAPCAPGFEPFLAAEVATAGGTQIKEDRGGVSFQGQRRVGYHLALWSRVAVRVLEELVRKRIEGPDDLYALASSISWRRYLAQGQTLAVFAALADPRVRHSQYAAQRIKDAVVDQLRTHDGSRPSVDREDPDLPLKLVVRDRVAILARDLAGQSLHKRGWRPVQVKAPLNESVAAGLLQLTEWDRTSPLCDPMCGSGTFLIEAAHLAGDRAPGLRRSFALERWPDFEPGLWQELTDEAEQRWKVGREQIPPLMGNDQHAGAIAIAQDAVARAEVSHAITLTVGDITAFQPQTPPAVVVVNPPYGVRLGEGEALEQTWFDLGRFLKGLGGGTAFVLSGDRALTQHLRLKSSQRIPIVNGGLDCRWLRYELRV